MNTHLSRLSSVSLLVPSADHKQTPSPLPCSQPPNYAAPSLCQPGRQLWINREKSPYWLERDLPACSPATATLVTILLLLIAGWDNRKKRLPIFLVLDFADQDR